MKLLDYELLNFLLLLYDAIFISVELKILIKIFLIWNYSLGENKTNILDFFLGKVLFSSLFPPPSFFFCFWPHFGGVKKVIFFFSILKFFSYPWKEF